MILIKSYQQLLNILFIAGIISCNAPSQPVNCEKKDAVNFITTPYGCTFIKVFKSDSLTQNPQLLFILHGDAPFNPPSYQYKLAEMLSQQVKNTMIVAILRPGYTDNEGNKSDGKKGLTTGDNYTKEIIDNLTEVVIKLKKIHKPLKTILIGHSGGATIAADIISLTPNIVDTTVLVSCPCDVEAFRTSMARKQPFYRAWRDSVASISPITVAEKLDEKTAIYLIHGTKDDIVPFSIAENYEKTLTSHKTKTYLTAIENAGHEIFLSETVLNILKNCLR
jgi:predicted esterase